MSVELMQLPSELSAACKAGDYDAAMAQLDAFMASHPSMTRQYALVQVALWALDRYHIDFHRACLENGGLVIDPAEKDINQAFAFRAVACDDLPMLQLYLEKGELPLDIGSTYTGDLLNFAAMKNAIAVATWLLDEKNFPIDSDRTMYEQPIPVVVAATWPDDDDDTRFLQLLLDRGVTFKGTGAICEAAFEGHVAAVYQLLEHGADIEEVASHDQIDERTDLGTPLWMAAANGDVETVEYLIERGANLHYRDDRLKLTVLEVAREREFEECVAVIEKALQEGK
jgi:ankyrin repeat protein